MFAPQLRWALCGAECVRGADRAIEYEHNRLCRFDKARSEANLKTRLEQYEQAAKECYERIDFYQHFEDALSMLIPSLYLSRTT